MQLIVLGSTGFVGSAVVAAAREQGLSVTVLPAPRLTTPARTASDLLPRGAEHEEAGRLAEAFASADAVVNAAGVADASARDTDELFGANALLPCVIEEACRRADVRRLVHVSSAAVQGHTKCLTAGSETAPFSPYSQSKALAEAALRKSTRTVVYRPTSVHGRGRSVTATLVRFASSRAASVAAPGTRPTPQVHVDNVGHAVVHLALAEDPPGIVLHPWEGLTTSHLLEVLGHRAPRHVNGVLARLIVATAVAAGRVSPRVAALARRLEMVWFGQRQEPGWLEESDWRPRVGDEGWRRLREVAEPA